MDNNNQLPGNAAWQKTPVEPQKTNSAKKTTKPKAKNSSNAAKATKDNAVKKNPKSAAVPKPDIDHKITASSEDSLYNLHQETDLWPEAWPEAELSGFAHENTEKPTPPVNPRQTQSKSISNESRKMPKEQHKLGESVSSELAENKEIETNPVNGKKPFSKHKPRHEHDAQKTEKQPKPTPEKQAKGSADKPVKATAQGKKRCKMFISVLPGEQIEAAITEDGHVLEYYVQMLHQLKTKGNIYKGVIHNVDANLQAAFISYGAAKNGFLQIDEVHPEYYLSPHDSSKGKKYPLIQKVLKAGQEVLVQVIKEPTGGKGAFLSTYLSIPGRFLVLTPGKSQLGVSRKVEDEEDRERLRKLIDGLPTQEGLGVIVRTASINASKTSMLKDLQFLKRQWKEVRSRGEAEPAPCLVYEEPSLASRAVRDYLSDDVKEIWVDDEDTAKELKETVNLIFPRRTNACQIKLHNPTQQSMWDAFDLQTQLDQIYSREVNLPSGGRLVFDQTEALMAIDINSGKITGRSNFESMALRTNMEAAQVIAQQLRLRDIGGQIVIDFIEMRERNHWRELAKVMRQAMKSDRARFDIAKVSSFGLMEVVRQRLGSSSISITMEPCPCCDGTGLRRNMEWQALHALREIQHKLRPNNEHNGCVIYETEPEIALYLLNNKRSALIALEEHYDTSIEVRTKNSSKG